MIKCGIECQVIPGTLLEEEETVRRYQVPRSASSLSPSTEIII